MKARCSHSRRGTRWVAMAMLMGMLVLATAAVAQQPVATGPQATARTTDSANPSTAAKEQRFDQARISLWLRPLARVLHVSTDALWTAVMLINFAILIWVLYVLLYRLKRWSLPSQMRGRSQTIRRRLAEADEAIQDASERLRDIEQRLDGVGAEIAELEARAAQEAEMEYRRLAAEAEAEAEKVGRAAELRIEAAAKLARQELRHYAGELAVAMAEKRLRGHVNLDLDRRVVRRSLDVFTASQNGETEQRRS